MDTPKKDDPPIPPLKMTQKMLHALAKVIEENSKWGKSPLTLELVQLWIEFGKNTARRDQPVGYHFEILPGDLANSAVQIMGPVKEPEEAIWRAAQLYICATDFLFGSKAYHEACKDPNSDFSKICESHDYRWFIEQLQQLPISPLPGSDGKENRNTKKTMEAFAKWMIENDIDPRPRGPAGNFVGFWKKHGVLGARLLIEAFPQFRKDTDKRGKTTSARPAGHKKKPSARRARS